MKQVKTKIDKYYNHIGQYCSQIHQNAQGAYVVDATVGSLRPTGGAAREANLATYKENHKMWLEAGLQINKRELRRSKAIGGKRHFKTLEEAIIECDALESILESLVK